MDKLQLRPVHGRPAGPLSAQHLVMASHPMPPGHASPRMPTCLSGKTPHERDRGARRPHSARPQADGRSGYSGRPCGVGSRNGSEAQLTGAHLIPMSTTTVRDVATSASADPSIVTSEQILVHPFPADVMPHVLPSVSTLGAPPSSHTAALSSHVRRLVAGPRTPATERLIRSVDDRTIDGVSCIPNA